MDGYSVRPATPNDTAAVTKLLRASYPALMKTAYAPEVLEIALPFMTRANARLLASGTYFVAENRKNEVVGCGGWTREAPGTGNVEGNMAHIRHFATHPAWTGQGIGRAVYNVCEPQAAAAGVVGFDCFASLNAEGFYAAIGFVRVDRIDVSISSVTFPAVLMRRRFRTTD